MSPPRVLTRDGERALGQVFLRILPHLPVSIILPMLSTHSFITVAILSPQLTALLHNTLSH